MDDLEQEYYEKVSLSTGDIRMSLPVILKWEDFDIQSSSDDMADINNIRQETIDNLMELYKEVNSINDRLSTT